MESVEEDLGQETPLCHDNHKFTGVPNNKIKDVLHTSKLLDAKTHDLCKDMEKLVTHSVTRNATAQHGKCLTNFATFIQLATSYSLK